MTSGSGEPVGSVGEEAAKLFGAFQEWARESGHQHGGASAAAAEGLAGAVRGLDQHVATGAAECTWCPVCRAISAVRDIDPEVQQHLATAMTSLAQAAAGLLATDVPDGARRTAGPVRETDPDDDEGEDD
jgi:hypothetical protein